MTQKLELANVTFSVRPVNLHEDDKGKIPDKLAEATFTLLHIHKANGDLSWVSDMAFEMEQGYEPGNSVPERSVEDIIDAPENERSPKEQAPENRAIDTFREYFEDMAEKHGTDAAWQAVNRLAKMCSNPVNITP